MSADNPPVPAGIPAAPVPAPPPTPVRPGVRPATLRVPWADGMRAGRGYDSVTQAVRGDPLPRGMPIGHEPGRGHLSQYVSKKVDEVESVESLHDMLQLGTSMNVGYDAFSANSIGRFMKETQVDSYNLYFVVVCHVENTAIEITDFALDHAVASLPDDEFRNDYGDYYLRGWIEGGYLIGLIEISATSAQSLVSVKAEARAEFNAAMFEAGSTVASSWEKWKATNGLTCRVHVTYAGMEGVTYDTVISSTPRPPPDTPAPPAPAPAPAITPHTRRAADGVAFVGNPDEPMTAEDTAAFLRREKLTARSSSVAPSPSPAPGPAPAPAPAAGPAPAPREPFEHINPVLVPNPPVKPEKVDMAMQSLLDAASRLDGQVRTHGVPLYALMESYTPRHRRSSGPDIARASYDESRARLNNTYMKALHVFNCVSFAIEHAGEFPKPLDELKKTQAAMRALMTLCGREWEALSRDPAHVVSDEVTPPADSDIPAMAHDTPQFKPFDGTLDPAAFVILLQGAVKAARASSGATREALVVYLRDVISRSGSNWERAADALAAVAQGFDDADRDKPKRRAAFTALAVGIASLAEEWKADSKVLQTAFATLQTTSDLDQDELKKMATMNGVLFGPDHGVEQQRYGFAAFWAALQAATGALAMQSASWASKAPLNELVDIGEPAVLNKARQAFRAQIGRIEVDVRPALNAPASDGR